MQFPTTLIIGALSITTVVAQSYDSCTSSTAAPIDSSIPAQAASAWVSFFAHGHQTSADSTDLLCSNNEGCYSYNGEAFCYDVSTSTARFADGSSGNLQTASYHVNELAKVRRAVDSSSSSSSSKALSTTVSTVSTTSAKLTTTTSVKSNSTVPVTSTSKPATSTSSSSKSSVVLVSTTSKPASSTSATSTAKASTALANGMIHAVPEGGLLVLGAAGLVALLL